MRMRGVHQRPSVFGLAGFALVASVLAVSGQQPTPQEPSPTAQQPQSPAPPAQQPPAGQQPERTQQPPIRSGINFVRVDVIVSDGKGQPVGDLKADDFTVSEDGKPQKVESFSVIKIDNIAQADRSPDVVDPQRLRRRARGGTAGRPSVRHPARRLSRAPRQLDERAQAADRLHPESAGSCGHGRADVPADAGRGHSVLARQGRADRGDRALRGTQVRLPPRNPFEEQYAFYPAATVERIRNQITMGALEGCRHPDGRSSRGPQVGDMGQRGIHRYAAATAERSGRRDARAGQPGTGPSHARRGQRSSGVLQHRRSEQRDARRVRDREPSEHVDLPGRSARSRGFRVRHQRSGGSEHRSPGLELFPRHTAG